MRTLLISTIALTPMVGFAGEPQGTTARERYEAGLQKVRQAYEAEVQAEIRAAAARGAQIEVNRLVLERNSIADQPAGNRAESPAEMLTKKIEETSWVFDDGGYVTFLEHGKATNNKREDILWVAADEKTVFQQNLRTKDFFVWTFSADAETVTRHAFRFREDSAREPAKSTKLTLTPPETASHATNLNQKIVSFCNWKLGKKVGDGICVTFVKNAVLSSGGRLWYRNNRGTTDFKWGKQVYYQERKDSDTKSSGARESILPGDIIEFHGCRFSGKGWWVSFGSHVAVIVASKNGGKVFTIMHANYSGNPNVQASKLDFRTLEKGCLRVYRPQPDPSKGS